MYRAEQFAAYFLGQGLRPNSLNNYQVVLRKVDRAIGGLDEKLTSEGGNAVLRWAQTATAESLRPYLKDLTAITKNTSNFSRSLSRTRIRLLKDRLKTLPSQPVVGSA